jgi:hypothetical protein
MLTTSLVGLLWTGLLSVPAEAANDWPEPVVIEGVSMVNECTAEVWGNGKYEMVACAGQKHLQQGRYDDAASSFERALAIPRFEIPNFLLFSKLALAQALAGSADEAERALLKARLTHSFNVGFTSCSLLEVDEASREEGTFRLKGGEVNIGLERLIIGEDIDRELVTDAYMRMCSEGIGSGLATLGGMWLTMQPVKEHLDIQELLKSRINITID